MKLLWSAAVRKGGGKFWLRIWKTCLLPVIDDRAGSIRLFWQVFTSLRGFQEQISLSSLVWTAFNNPAVLVLPLDGTHVLLQLLLLSFQRNTALVLSNVFLISFCCISLGHGVHLWWMRCQRTDVCLFYWLLIHACVPSLKIKRTWGWKTSLASCIIHIGGRQHRCPWDSPCDARATFILFAPLHRESSNYELDLESMKGQDPETAPPWGKEPVLSQVTERWRKFVFFNSIFITFCLLLTILLFWDTSR